NPAVRDRQYHYQAEVDDPDGDTILWSIEGDSLDPEIDIDQNGLVTWTPKTAGSFEIQVTADDQNGGGVTQTFTLVVLHNAPPIITSDPERTVDLLDDYEYEVIADDPN